MIKMLLIIVILFGSIFFIKACVKFKMGKAMSANQAPAVTVSAIKVTYQDWQSKQKAVGSVRAIRGVDVTTELAGMVKTIAFTPGADVKEGELLVELNTDTDMAQLLSLQAQADLSQIIYNRDKAQYAFNAISKTVLDTDLANLKSAQAKVTEQKALIDKKIIHAPFDGHLGISQVNPGQFINPGDPIVTLQSLTPIYIDFYLPQQALTELAVGQKIQLSTDTYPGQLFTGEITTINPKVDVATRNVQVEATVSNEQRKLLPGMFTTVEITIGKPLPFLTLPQTAISFNPYGEVVFVITQKGTEKGKPLLIANQAFVKVGQTRGDQIAVLSGIKEGDLVVTAGQLKLKNGSRVIVNNSIEPSNNAHSKVPER